MAKPTTSARPSRPPNKAAAAESAVRKTPAAVAKSADPPAPHDESVATAGAVPETPAEAELEATDAQAGTEPAAAPPHTATPESPRFRIYVIDTGWNSVARKVLMDNFALIRDLNEDDPAYVLDRDMSVALLRRYRTLIGRDPIIAVHDIYALDHLDTKRVRGFRLHLGLLRTEDQVLSALQTFARFIATHRASITLEADIRKGLRREGLAGAIEIVMNGPAHSDMLGL